MVPAAFRDEYVVVWHIEPVETNAAARGFDVASDPVRRQALLRACETGEPAATEPIRLVQDAADPDACLIMDPFHILRGGSPLADIALVPGDKVAIWHWNDVPGTKPVGQQSDADRVLPGDGVGPLQEIERLALQQGYQGFVSLELFNPALWQRDPEEVARLGMEKMKRFFA